MIARLRWRLMVVRRAVGARDLAFLRMALCASDSHLVAYMAARSFVGWFERVFGGGAR